MASNSTLLYKCLPMPAGDYKNAFDVAAIRMAILHNIIIRGINSIVSQAPEIQPAQQQAFLTYCICFYDYVHHHHALEEDLYFGLLQEKMGEESMKSNIKGHEDFHKPFNAWIELCRSNKEGKVAYDGESLALATRTFADALVPHLADEIETLSSEKMRKAFSEKELQTIDDKIEAKHKSESSLVWGLPIFIVNNEAITGGWFPPLPAPIRFMLRSVFIPLHKDVWAFGASDKNSIVKPRYAEGEA